MFSKVFFITIGLQRIITGQELIDKISMNITSSSTHDSGVFEWYASRAIDGDARRDPDQCQCCAATRHDWEPWYRVDLGRVYNIHSVEVIGRLSSHSLKNMRVTYGTTSYTEAEMFTNTQDVFVASHTLQPSPQPGRYMELKLVQTSQYFVICELNVYKECKDGTYGSGCTTPCGYCLNDVPCAKDTGFCQSCDAGYKGDKCDEDCVPGEYGRDCSEICGRCKVGTQAYNRFNGSCTECQTGFLEPLCKVCIGGKYGQNCDLTCGYCRGGRICDPETGKCPQGCTDGYNGTRCTSACPAGTFGLNCDSVCGSCSKGDVCRFDIGYCERGSEPGLKQPLCLKVCEDGSFGINCSETCGYCSDKTSCNKIDGRCQSCDHGYIGDRCMIKFPVCDSDEKDHVFAVAIVGTAATIFVFEALIVAVIMILRRRSDGKQASDNLYEIPNRNVTENEHPYGQSLDQQIADTNYVNSNMN